VGTVCEYGVKPGRGALVGLALHTRLARVTTLDAMTPPFSPPSINWQGRLDGAASEAEVVAAAREFIASFDPYEIDTLPEACRPGKLFTADDVTEYAFVLISHRCAESPEAAALVHKLADFFGHATVRLSRIAGRLPPA
jgi:hypothetical protein